MSRRVADLEGLNLRARLACALAVQGAPHALVQGTVSHREYLDAVEAAARDQEERGNLDVRDGLRTALELLEQEEAHLAPGGGAP